jgi:hypothetical protein
MHTSSDALEAQQLDGYEGRMTDWGELRVAWESFAEDIGDMKPLFVGLPDDHCQCPHHGYVFEGAFRVEYVDGRSETVSAGEAYVLEPGHLVTPLGALRLLEFSPAKQHDETMAVIMQNLQAAEA